jgi:hypothetical protein
MSRLRFRRRWVPLLVAEDATPGDPGDNDNDPGGPPPEPPEPPYEPPPVLGPPDDPGVLNPGVVDEWEQYADEDPINGKRLGWSLIDPTMQWLAAWGARTIKPDVLGYDDFESYTADVNLNGLSGGEAWGGALIARRVAVPRANGWTDFSDATTSSDINGQTSGDWSGAFIAR